MDYYSNGRDVALRIARYRQYIENSSSDWVEVSDCSIIEQDFEILKTKEKRQHRIMSSIMIGLFCVVLVQAVFLINTVDKIDKSLFIFVFLFIIVFLIIDVVCAGKKGPFVISVKSNSGATVKRAKVSAVKRLVRDMQNFENRKKLKK